MAILLASLAFLAVLAIVVGAYVPRLGRGDVENRLQAFARRPRTLAEIELEQPFSERVVRPLIQKLSALVLRLRQRGEETQRKQRQRENLLAGLQRKLNLAGNPYNWTPADFLGVKAFGALIIAPIGFFIITVAGHPTLALLGSAAGALVGYFGPDLWLRSKIRARQSEIVKTLPDALDLLVISVEAGLGFDAALARYAEQSDNALAREFGRVLTEIRVGKPRREALRDMVARTEVQDLANFVSALIQADQLGVSVAKVLTVQAEQMRVLRRQRAEALAAQAPLKMLVPMAIFIFPALCVVILGPIWPQVARSNALGVGI